MKKKFTSSLIVTFAALIIVVVLAAVLGILKATDVLKSELTAFEIMFSILTLGAGVTITAYGIVKKGGYETAIGIALLDIGVILTMIFYAVYWVVTLIVAIAILLITVFTIIMLNAKRLYVERANEKEDYKPYTEVIKEKQAEEKIREENEPMPEIKSFKNTLKK